MGFNFNEIKDILVEMNGLILTIVGFFASLLLFITYYNKQRYGSIKSKLFRLLLVFCIALSITDVLSFLILKLEMDSIAIKIAYKIDWLVGLIWYSFFYYYSICVFMNIESENIFMLIKNNKKFQKFTYMFILACIICVLIPINKLDSNNISWLPKYISYYVIFVVYIITFLVVFSVIFNKNILNKNKLLLFLIISELLVFSILQFAFQNISFAPMTLVLNTYILYFSIENPDLRIISEVKSLKDDIEMLSNTKTDFLSNMSHEIRSPMNAIVGFSYELMTSSKDDELTIKNDIQNINDAGNNLLEIINNILDISKIETGKEELYMKEYSILNMVNELANITKTRLLNKNVEFILNISENIPSKLYGDQTKLYQILLNILSNSAKYTNVGKIGFVIDCDIKDDIVLLHFRISDTGYGIKKEDYDKLFEKFSRLDSATLNKIEGTGLGLAITKKYVDLMGGKIWFDSEYKVGTNFYVDINQKIIDKTPISSVSQTNNVVNNSNFLDCSKYKILVVDDNKLNLKVAKRIFGKYNFSIDTLENGDDCINKIKSGEQYDMIFLDHMMPELDGIETLHILRKLYDFDIPPVVALTANAVAGMKEMYLNEGFDEYLSKPINAVELDKLINKYFNK